ncbi:MAG: metallophosphoesterase family protein [Planctomycetes bacterium]|nr:metallophosphoesterase family protein [Planctomycetota bacterium]
MAFAVISDVHSNIEALTAVLADIDARGLDPIYCLGDVVGYGPDPEACIDLVERRCKVTIRGNHDEALFSGADRFNPYARHAIDWTKSRIKPGLFRGRATTRRWRFLQELPLDHREGEHYFVHGSPRDPVNEYVYREDVFFNAEGKLRTIFKTVDRLLFIGHTHLPVVISDALETFVPGEQGFEIALQPGRKYLVNVGSVGQPRDRDVRACYVEVDDDLVRYHRVAYEVEAVVKKIGANPALDSVLGSRLLVGM